MSQLSNSNLNLSRKYDCEPSLGSLSYHFTTSQEAQTYLLEFTWVGGPNYSLEFENGDSKILASPNYAVGLLISKVSVSIDWWLLSKTVSYLFVLKGERKNYWHLPSSYFFKFFLSVGYVVKS